MNETTAPPGTDGFEASSRTGRLRIGAWWVDAATNRIDDGDETRHLEPKVMDVLRLLARRAGEVVSREELLAEVWAGSVVGDDTLTQVVIKLRKALRDDSRAPAYIETIAKRGYRLIASVVVEEAGRAGMNAAPLAAAVDTPATGGAPSGRGWRAHPRRWLAGALLLVGGLYALLWFVPPKSDSSGLELPAPPALDAEAFGGRPTITVLPFESLGETSPDYLARGITADLATDLARLAGLRVIRALLQGGAPPAARYLVTGSTQSDRERLKINVWLLDAASGRQLWSERYERPRSELIAVQEDIVERLVRALPIQVGEEERRRLASHHTRNLEAYELFLQALAAHLTHLPEENRQARELYRQAMRLDPGFARAHAGLAMTYANDYRYQWSDDGGAALKRAMELATIAHEINAEVREVYWVLAYVNMQRHQPRQAILHLLRAIKLDPSYSDAYGYMGAVYVYSGQPERALSLLRHGLRLHPDGGYLYYMSLGEAYLFLGENEQALLNLNESLARNPANLETRVFLAAAHAAAGNREAARWEAEEIRTLAPGFALRDWLETSPLTDAARKGYIVGLLREYGL